MAICIEKIKNSLVGRKDSDAEICVSTDEPIFPSGRNKTIIRHSYAECSKVPFPSYIQVQKICGARQRFLKAKINKKAKQAC
jgi:hypothetical protein